jgi:hypothetical protein
MNTKKLYVFLTFIAVFALISTMLAVSVKPVKAAEQITIVNHQGFLDSTGYYVVFGEVKNNGDTPAKNVYVKITFTSSSGPDEDEVETQIHTILPGRRAPFMGSASEQGSLVTSYKVELMDLTMSTEDLPKTLEIVSAKSEVNIINNLMITGTVKNNGAETATYTRVYATIYDGPSGTGNVVGVTSGTTKPNNVATGDTGTFEIGFLRTTSKSYASMVIVAESDQYEATTEYTVATSQTSTTTPSPTSQTPSTTPSQTSQPASTAPSSSANLSPSPSIPEFPSTIAAALVIVATLIVAVAAKRKQR